MKQILFFLSFIFLSISGFSQELLTNGDFETGDLSNWTTNNALGGNTLGVINDSGNNLFEAVVNTTGANFEANLSYPIDLTMNETYVLEFDAYTDATTATRSMDVGLGQSGSPFIADVRATSLTSTSQRFSYQIEATWANSPSSRVIFDMGSQAGTVFIDNVSLQVFVPDTNTDATLSDLQVDGATVAGFSPNTTSYEVFLDSDTTVPVVTATASQAAMGATVDITAASSIPGTTTVEVTAPDTTTTQTYTVNFSVVPPAPVPPGREATSVVSIFSDSYTNISNNGVNTFGAGPLTLDNVTLDGNGALRATVNSAGDGFQYNVGIGSGQDLTNFTHMHFDYYVSGSLAGGEVINTILQTFDSGGVFQNNISYTEAVSTSGGWVSVDVEISTFNTMNNDISNVGQIQFVFAGPVFGPVFLDNIYFHDNTTLSTKEFDSLESRTKIYPNPAPAGSQVKVSLDNVATVAVYNAAGKQVAVSNSGSINTAGLAAGVYIVQIQTENGGIVSKKLIVR